MHKELVRDTALFRASSGIRNYQTQPTIQTTQFGSRASVQSFLYKLLECVSPL